VSRVPCIIEVNMNLVFFDEEQIDEDDDLRTLVSKWRANEN